MRPAGLTEVPIARLTGAGRDETSKAGVSVSRTGNPGPSLGPGTASIIQGTNSLLSARLSTMLQDLGIPKDAPALLALQALMGEGLGLSAETIKAVRAVVMRHAAEPGRAAVLAARALAAGLQPDDDGIETLIRSLSALVPEESVKEPDRLPLKQPGRDTQNSSGKDPDAEPEGDSGRDSGGAHHRNQQRDQQRDQQGQLANSSKVMIRRECLDEAELRNALESAFRNLSSRAASDPGFASLARRGPDGRGWLCVPYQFSIDGVDFSGYFRIVFNYASSKVERLVAEIDSSGLTRVVDVSWGPVGKPQLRYRPGSVAEGGAFARAFGGAMKVELIPQGEDSALMDSDYPEVDGHA